MKHHLIDPPFCLIANQRAARQQFQKRLNMAVKKPLPYLFLYQDTNFRNICWLDEPDTNQETFILPAFGPHYNDLLFFKEQERIPLTEGSIFYCRNEFFIVLKEKSRGLCLKQVAIVNTQPLLNCIAEDCGLQQYEFVLCKASEINQGLTTVAYVWSGWYCDEETDLQYRALLPVFTEDFATLQQHNPWSLHYEPLSAGDFFCRQGETYLVKSDAGGIYIDESPLKILH